MATAKGSKVLCSMGEESTYGTASATEYLQLGIAEFNGGLKRTSNASRILRGDRNPTESFLGRKDVSFDLVLQPGVREIAFLMKHALGSNTTTGAGPYTHTTKVGTLPVGLTFDKFFQDLVQVQRYTGCRINGFEFTVNDDGLLEVTLHVIGSDETDAVALIDVSPKAYAMQPFAVPRLTIQEGGAGLTIGKDFHLTFMNNLDVETGRVMGNAGKVADLPEGIVSVEFEMSVLFQSTALLNKAKNETESSIMINFPAPSATHSFQLDLKEVKYHVEEPSARGPNGIVVPMRGRGYYTDDAAASSIIATTINDVTSIATIPA
jgi:hypothetical protein